MSQFAGSATRCFKAATAGLCRVPVKQALNLQTNTLWLSDAGQCADVPVPAAERVQVVSDLLVLTSADGLDYEFQQVLARGSAVGRSR